MAQDMKFIKYQQGIGCFFFDNVDVGYPHITLQPTGSFDTDVFKKLVECIFASALTRSDQLSDLKIVNIGKIYMAFTSGDLINANMCYARKISVLRFVFNNEIHGIGDSSPRTLK